MKSTVRLSRLLSLLVCLALAVSLAPPQPAQAVSTSVVISQVYGGGGNSGAPYKNDFVELFNRGSSTVSLSGWSVQYASATGTGNFANNSITLLSGSLQPGQYYLVQESGGTTGAALPTPDATGSVNMSATAGKVALVNVTTGLACNGGNNPCSSAQLAQIVDLIGYGGANFFEGSSPAPILSNTTADLRANSGCTDSDNNIVDFAAGAPAPRNSASPFHDCSQFPYGFGTASPTVVSVGETSLLTVTVTPAISPASTGLAVTADLSAIGGSSSQVFYDDGTHGDATAGDNVSSFLAQVTSVTSFGARLLSATITDAEGRTGTATIYIFTRPPKVAIHAIQGASHISPMVGDPVTAEGIVTAETSSGFYLEAPASGWDSDPATSEGIFVYTASTPTVEVGDDAVVSGTVNEFRPGGSGGLANLTTTELVSPFITVSSSGNPLPPPIVIGTGGRIPPTVNIESDATGNVETSGVFNPDVDGIDFYESLEGMYVQVNNAQVVGATENFGSNSEIPVVGDNGANVTPGLLSPRGGIVIQPGNFNPERIILNDLISGTSRLPVVNVGDKFPGAILGVIDYGFGNYKLEVTSLPGAASGGLAQQQAAPAAGNQLAVATFNVENLAPTDPPSKFSTLAGLIVNNLRSPDLIAIEEVQDNNGVTDTGVVDASTTWTELISAIQVAGGPSYQYRQIDPVNNEDGGAPGGNIRQGFLFRTDRGLNFVDRPGAGSTTANTVVQTTSGPILQFSPGRIDPTNTAFTDSRKPLAGEFLFRGRPIFVIANHFNSKGGDDPLFGRFQPPVFNSETQRIEQAQVVHDFVSNILTDDPNANVIVLGDLNDFQFSTALHTLEGSPSTLTDLIDTLPADQRYTYVYDGNSEVLDHTLLSSGLTAYRPYTYQVVHVNSEFAVQASDHEPQAALIAFNPPSVKTPTFILDPSAVSSAVSAQAAADYIPGDAPYTCTVDYGDGSGPQAGVITTPAGETVCTGPSHTYSQPGSYTVTVSVANQFGEAGSAATTHVVFNFTGFFSPVINPTAFNVVAAGSIVPIKFSLNGDQGLDILANGYPVSQSVDCKTGMPDGPIQATITAGASGLNYDPVANQYNYIWNTDTSWAGTCRQVAIKLVDGTAHLALFRFK
jgi:predicted extracellular nuclease